MIDEEVWRGISWLPDVIASSHGRLMRLPHQKPLPHGGTRWYGGTPTVGIWEPTQARYTYSYKGKTFRVARLICEAFHGPPPPEMNVCMHLDESTINNRQENLKWGTQKENLNAPGFLVYLKTRARHTSAKAKTQRIMAPQ